MGSYIESYSGADHFKDNVNYEVQRQNHFEISIDLKRLNLGPSDIYSEHIRLCCTNAGIPNLTIDPVDLKHGNEIIHVAGQPKFTNSSIKVYDTIGSNMANMLQSWFWRIFNPETHLMGLVTSYKTDAQLYLYSPDASVIRCWDLIGVFPTSLNFGEMSSDGGGGVQQITMELSVDRSILRTVKGNS